MADSLTYADAGVNIDKANRFIDEIKKIAKKTHSSAVIGDIGGFGGLFSLQVENYERPVLVSSTDGVGTKLKIAIMMDKHDTIGIDLVAMCVNDIAVQGAKPLFFLDYLAMGRLDTDIASRVIKGIGDGCKEAGCALIGGETAEMPGMYNEKDYDLAGFTVGIVDNSKIIDGSMIHVGNKIVGISSSGLHSNGYSLVRKICFDLLKLTTDAHIPELGCSLGEELLRPTLIYSDLIHGLLRDLPLNGLAHITGGGITDNLLRIIPGACRVVMKKYSWEVPPIFSFLQKAGRISEPEMMRTFNNGIGLIAVIPDSAVEDIMNRCSAKGIKAFVMGEILEEKKSGERLAWE